jgi:polar amino acid transport system substrate-binding protein
MYRTRLFEKEAPNLVRVPVLLDNFVITTMTKAASLAAPTLEQAAGMHVGIRRGMRNVESLTAGWPNVERAVETFAMLKMLNTGNIDVIIGYPENLRYTLEQVGLSPDLYSFKEVHRDPAYHYLNKRHAALVPALTAEFNNIKGKYDSVVEGFMARGNK